MNEKVKSFLQSEGLKNFSKKVFNKKTITTVLVVVILAAVLNIGFHLLFEVNGIVKGIDGTKLTVADFFSTRTIDVGSGANITGIKVGDRVRITKNLAGQVLTVSTGHDGRGGDFYGRHSADRGFDKSNGREDGGPRNEIGRGRPGMNRK